MKPQLLFLIFFVCLIQFTWAQQDTIRIRKGEILILEDEIVAPENDTIYLVDAQTRFKIRKNPYTSSDTFYEKLKEKTSGNKVTDKIGDLFLVNIDKKTLDIADAGISSEALFEEHTGKVIRNIRFIHVDILEGSVQDTSRTSSSRLSLLANKYHVDTKQWVLKNNITLKPGKEINSFIMADNERLLRRLPYVEDAKIYVNRTSDPSMVDLVIAVKDRISWGFQSSYDDVNQFNFELFNRSVAGWGRYGSINYFHNSNSSPMHGYEVKIGGQNPMKTFTSWEFSHANYWDKFDYGLNVQKEFLTPQVKYGGGVEFRTIKDSTISLDGDLENGRYYKLNYQDVWVGRSFLIQSKGERKNVVISTRLLNHEFDQRPPIASDSNEIYFDRVLVLAQFAFAEQRFIKANYVQGFGISEDIPIGYRASVLVGRDYNEFYTQDYLGLQYYWSKYIKKKGYFLFNVQLASFIDEVLKTGVISSGVSYYTPIKRMGRYRLRSYLNFGYTNGVRQPQAREVTLQGKIRDINGTGISGDKLAYGRFESVLFTPWYLYGFRFAPFIYGSLSEIQDNRTIPHQHKYTSMGVGFRLKNESLVFNTFEFRVTRFIHAPESSDDLIFGLSVTTPITFDNIFRYKPRMVPFE